MNQSGKEAQNASGAQPAKPAASNSASPAHAEGLVAERQMPELDQPTVAFLALLRDLYVLAGTQSGPADSEEPASPKNSPPASAIGR